MYLQAKFSIIINAKSLKTSMLPTPNHKTKFLGLPSVLNISRLSETKLNSEICLIGHLVSLFSFRPLAKTNLQTYTYILKSHLMKTKVSCSFVFLLDLLSRTKHTKACFSQDIRVKTNGGAICQLEITLFNCSIIQMHCNITRNLSYTEHPWSAVIEQQTHACNKLCCFPSHVPRGYLEAEVRHFFLNL